jgi:hypothetical protein
MTKARMYRGMFKMLKMGYTGINISTLTGFINSCEMNNNLNVSPTVLTNDGGDVIYGLVLRKSNHIRFMPYRDFYDYVMVTCVKDEKVIGSWFARLPFHDMGTDTKDIVSPFITWLLNQCKLT